MDYAWILKRLDARNHEDIRRGVRFSASPHCPKLYSRIPREKILSLPSFIPVSSSGRYEYRS